MTRQLYFCILDANRANRLKGDDWFDHPPTWEARNPPSEETTGATSEKKIPDLHWGYIDHDEPDPRRSARHFVIECKRLGAPTASGWAFNLHYVDDGIVRFQDPAFKYGHAVASGAMVAYVESMTVDAILAEVNATTDSRGITAIAPRGSPSTPLHEFEHTFDRPFPASPFRLVHLWVELPLS